MNNDDDVQTSSKQQQQQPLKQKPPRKSPHQSNCINNTSSKQSSKVFKQPNRSISNQKQPSTKLKCTRCGSTRLHDITHHEFPKQKGLVFECAGCGNNSIRSNVSADERRRRLAKVATDHLSRVECQFCHKIFHAHNDYLKHLRDDHNSNK
jgi:hypothetical protein